MRKIAEKKGLLTAEIIICALLIWGIYIFCLRQIPAYEFFSLWIVEDYWLTYSREIVWMTGIGILLALAGRAQERGRKGAFLFWLIFAVLSGFLLPVFMKTTVFWKWKKLLLSLWPFLVFVLAKGIKERVDTLQRSVFGVVCYYAAAFIGIWIIEEKLVWSEFYRRNPLELLYLFVTAVISWSLIGGRTIALSDKNVYFPGNREDEKWRKLLTVIAPVILFIVMFARHRRIYDILISLQRANVSSVETNWLKYRFALLFRGWNGDFTLLEEPFAGRIPCDCPVFWVNYVKGPFVALVLVGLEMLLICALLALVKQKLETRNNQSLIKILLLSFMIRAAFGLLTELFFIETPDIGALLLRNPGDIITVLYLVGYGIGKDAKIATGGEVCNNVADE